MEFKGTVRDPALAWAVCFVPMIGPFWHLYCQYAWLNELKAYLKDDSINPIMDVLVWPFLTCGLYAFYVPFKMGKLIQRAQIQAGRSNAQDQGMMFFLFTFLCAFVMYKEQEEMNKIWDPA